MYARVTEGGHVYVRVDGRVSFPVHQIMFVNETWLTFESAFHSMFESVKPLLSDKRLLQSIDLLSLVVTRLLLKLRQ